jgi:hypothetical protein
LIFGSKLKVTEKQKQRKQRENLCFRCFNIQNILIKGNKKAPQYVVLKVQMNHRLLGVYKRVNTLKTE